MKNIEKEKNIQTEKNIYENIAFPQSFAKKMDRILPHREKDKDSLTDKYHDLM